MRYRQLNSTSEHGSNIPENNDGIVINLHGEIELGHMNISSLPGKNSMDDMSLSEQEVQYLNEDLVHMSIAKRHTSDEDIKVLIVPDIGSPRSVHPLFSIERVLEYIYPPDQPIALQLWHSRNIALPISYLLVGTLQGLSSGVMTIFLLQIGATEAQQTTILSLRLLPAAMKILFGFISDSFPILGYRRKPYMFLGWIISSIAMIVLFMSEHNSTEKQKSSQSNISIVALLYFLFGFGFWIADVAADSVMAEKAKLESLHHRGQLQSTCYACRFFALMISITFATFTYDTLSPSILFLIMGILPWLSAIPATIYMFEEKLHVHPSIFLLWSEIWSTVCSQAVWQPMAFVFIYTSLQVGNSAWSQYLYTVLKFTSIEINSLAIVSYILLYIGVVIYKAYLRNINYRYIYICTSILGAFFSVVQIMLILQINKILGISNFLFSLGDDALSEFINGIQYLPTVILMATLCPHGSEGTTYAMFTSVNNSAIQVSSAISTKLLTIWDVSKDTMSKGNLNGFLKLTILTSAIQFSAVLFIGLLPRGVDDLKILDHNRKSSIGGFVFLFVVGMAITLTVTNSLLNILIPGWSGES